MTVNFTPMEQRSHYLIYGGRRHIVGTEHVRRELDMAGLVAGGSVWVGGAAG